MTKDRAAVTGGSFLFRTQELHSPLLNTTVMAKDFGRVGLGTLAIVAGAFLWGKFLYGRGVRGCQRWMCETFPDEYESMTEKVADMLEQDH